MAGPWDKYAAPQQAPQPVQQQPQQTPGVIMGRPRAPDPYRVQQDQINNQQESERLRLAQESAAIAAEKARFDIAKAQREADAGPAGSAAEGERKASGFLKRALNAENSYLNISDNPGPRSMVGQFMSDAAPNLLNSLPADIGNSPERQQADQAQREFIAAVLRYDSGAAIPPEEFVTNARIYYPQPGDGPEVIEQKAQARRVAIEGLRDSSGKMAPQAVSDPETAAQMTMGIAGAFAPQGAVPGGVAPQGLDGRGPIPGAAPDNITFDMDTGTGAFGSEIKADRLTPQQQAALDAFLKANAGNPNFGPDQLNAFYQSVGIEGGAMPGNDDFYSAVRSGEAFGTQPNYAEADAEAKRRAMEASFSEAPEGSDVSRVGLEKGLLLNMTDELRGGIGGVRSLLSGEGFMSGYQSERDIERALQERSREQNGVAPELVGGLLTPAGALGTARNAGQFIRQGAALGGVAGFGEGEGAANSLLSAAGGAAVGGAVGGALSQAPGAVNALLQSAPGQRVASAMRRNPGAVDREVIEAGQRQNIPIRQPDARPETRNAFAVVEASPTQGPKVKATLDADRGAVQSRLEQVGGSGTQLDNLTMGETVQGAGKRYIVNSGAQANALYRRAEQATGDARFAPEQALRAIDDNIAELTANGPRANAGQIKYLEDLKADLSRGDLSISQLRSIRTGMRGQINERNLTATDAERRVGQVIDAASADIQRGLTSNPQAQAAYKAADDFYREKQTFIKDVVQRFTGSRNNPLSAEQAASKFQAMMRNKGDYKRFSEMAKRLEPEERADMAASIAQELGKGRNGEFTLAGLATNVEKMNPRALRDLFGEDGAKAIADLRIIARAKADTAAGLNNSKSGVVMAGTNQFKDVLLGAVGGGVAGIPGALAGMAARGGAERLTSARAARLLLNPDFTKWLRQTPNSTNPAVINRHFDRLNKVASREQAFLMDAQALQEYLTRQFSEGVGRAAATGEQGENNGRK